MTKEKFLLTLFVFAICLTHIPEILQAEKNVGSTFLAYSHPVRK